MTGRIFIFSVIALGFLIIRDWDSGPVGHPAGILVAEKPLQVDLQPSMFMLDDYQLTRKASFDIRARVLSKEPYYLNRTADLAPIDLALGWGAMSDSAVLERIDISQSARWYRTRYDFPSPIPDQEIIASSSNMHMIPAGKGIEKTLKKLREGDIVQIRGYLVDVDHDSGWHWRSSMSRTDSGDGACELVYVESINVETLGR